MKENFEDDEEFTMKDYEELIKDLKRKSKYPFIVKAGKDFHTALFNLFSKVWEDEKKPEGWKLTLMIQLFKGKGSKFDFGNQRFIHMKEEIPKSFEQLIITKCKRRIVEYCSKFQIGAVPGHQPSEHLFTLKSIISFYQLLQMAIIISFYDIRKFFDSESLRDAMNSLYESEIRGKLYRLIFELNKNNVMTIQTGSGTTEPV